MVFAVAWEDVELEHVTAFLDGADEESLTWEAKGRTIHAGAVTKAVAGFANSQGGFLILGAERVDDGGWRATGAPFPGNEARTWLSSVIGNLAPVPQYEIKAWRLDDEAHVAVVRVAPLGAKPCITRDGQIFERTSGQTIPIKDPNALARLYESGERARSRAESIARRALELEPESPRQSGAGMSERQTTLLRVGLAPTGLPENMTKQLFGQPFAEHAFVEALKPHLHVGSLVEYPWYTSVEQGTLTAHLVGHDQAWIARASWDGSVGFAYSSWSDQLTTDDSVRIVANVWEAGVSLLNALGTTSPAHLGFTARLEPKRDVYVSRWIALEPPSEDDTQGIVRELRRARGERVWE